MNNLKQILLIKVQPLWVGVDLGVMATSSLDTVWYHIYDTVYSFPLIALSAGAVEYTDCFSVEG